MLLDTYQLKSMLKGSASDALRPYTPKKMKAMAIEKTKLWSKLNFGVKWNMRDIMRHKASSFMTLFGIFRMYNTNYKHLLGMKRYNE